MLVHTTGREANPARKGTKHKHNNFVSLCFVRRGGTQTLHLYEVSLLTKVLQKSETIVREETRLKHTLLTFPPAVLTERAPHLPRKERISLHRYSSGHASLEKHSLGHIRTMTKILQKTYNNQRFRDLPKRLPCK